MKYLILIHQNRSARAQFAAMPADVQASGMQAYVDLNAALAASGEYVSAEALADDSTSTVAATPKAAPRSSGSATGASSSWPGPTWAASLMNRLRMNPAAPPFSRIDHSLRRS
jgi:hypothetical protein